MALPQELPKCPRLSGHLGSKSLRRRSDHSFFVIFFFRASGFAIGLEPAALIEVDQDSAKLMRLKPSVQCLGAQSIRIQIRELLSGRPVARHQLEANQHLNEALASHQKAVSPFARGSWPPSLLAKWFLILGCPAIVKDANTTIQQPICARAGTCVVDAQNRPTDRLSAKIERISKP